MTVVTQVKSILESAGYSVEIRPQEKTYNKQILLLLDAMEFEVETQTTYRANFSVTIRYVADSADDAIAKTIEIMQLVEPNITALTFKFETPLIEIDSRVYYILLPFTYTEVINIE